MGTSAQLADLPLTVSMMRLMRWQLYERPKRMSDEDDEFGPWCEDIGQEHDWTEWAIGPCFPREERFCSKCGGMETQQIGGMQQ